MELKKGNEYRALSFYNINFILNEDDDHLPLSR